MPHKTLEARREYARKWAATHPGYGAAASRKRREVNPGAAREEYLKHKAGYVARSKAWQAKNPDKAKESKRKALLKARTEKPEHCRQLQRKWRLANKDSFNEKQRLWRLKNRPRCLELKRKWKTNNPDKIKAQKLKRTLAGKTREEDHRRRARLYAVGCENCHSAIANLKRERFCRWCCISLTKDNFTVDHIIPLSRGGLHKPDNLAAACKTCNLSKGNKLITEWIWEAA